MANEILTETRGRVLLITLNRPEAKNSVNSALGQALVAAIEALDADDGLTAGVLTGAGGGFSAGMDLKEFAVEGRTPKGFDRFLQSGSQKPLIAAVEGFAVRIAAGDVPPPLQDVSLLSLDIGLLQAGASMKGEFENRLRQVIEEVQSSPKPIILFVDEAHTLIGAGGAAGTGDAANLLKPALARGTLRTIAATTWAEYKKHIEKDPALTRRFQVIHPSRLVGA